MNNETGVMRNILLALSGFATLFRNNVGARKLEDGTYLKYGVGGEGGSDILGFKSVTVTQSMVGQKVAIFVAIEVKAPGARTEKERLKKQEHFVQVVSDAGGLAGFASSNEDAWDIIAT